jgi:hypothetical protein
MDIQTFAQNWAATTRKVRKATLTYHEAYAGADPEQQKDLRRRWMLGHLMGGLEVDAVKADRILSQSREERTAAHQDAVKRASADFSYHVIRPGSDGSSKSEPVRISRAHRQAAKSYLAQFDSLSAAIAALKAVAP